MITTAILVVFGYAIMWSVNVIDGPRAFGEAFAAGALMGMCAALLAFRIDKDRR